MSHARTIQLESKVKSCNVITHFKIQNSRVGLIYCSRKLLVHYDPPICLLPHCAIFK